MFSDDSAFEAIAKKVRNIPSLTREEEEKLFLEWKETKSEKAFTRLFESHLKLILRLAVSLGQKTDVPPSDLFQEGSMGLKTAIEKFDTQLGFRLQTYAVHRVRREMLNYVAAQRHMVHIGKSDLRKGPLLRILFDFKRSRNQFGSLTEEDVVMFAQKHGLSLEDVRDMDVLIRNPIISMDQPFFLQDEESAETLKDRLPDSHPSPEECLQDDELQENRSALLREAIALALQSPLELYIFENRVLKDKEDESRPTLEELHRRIGLSGERIRQIEIKSFRKVKARVRQLMLNKGITRRSLFPGSV